MISEILKQSPPRDINFSHPIFKGDKRTLNLMWILIISTVLGLLTVFYYAYQETPDKEALLVGYIFTGCISIIFGIGGFFINKLVKKKQFIFRMDCLHMEMLFQFNFFLVIREG